MSTITLRSRRPLDTLPLSQFTGLPLPPSPISLPSKRSLTSSPGRIGESSTSVKHRKVSGDIEGGQETIRRKKSDITPRAKRALAEDELGTGKSPARRLFVDEGISFGISGAVVPSPSGPSRTLDFANLPSNANIPGPSRGLAPSPPISSAPSPAPLENGATFNPHDPGFDIHPDPVVYKSYLGTPDSRPNRRSTAVPASPTSITSCSIPDHDQENIPPPRATPSSSTRSTPSKHSISGSSSSTRFYDDNEIVNLTGSGRRRVREPSKLNKVLKSSGVEPDEEDEELTPGRTRVGAQDKGKQKMTMEVNQLL